ncbi:hypothetical protein [Bosea sp. (in: a-proteobacteria)]|uniref:hypothetical protein n=1 Tax=Bosea sp. (in: a-proteobacteria) TaxID=1871050 RepID=UPI0025C1ADC7|nr:hypothetical protein [Bosea sp. (in: a-proteobacteria)]
MNLRSLLTHPVLWVGLVLCGLTALWLALGAPVGLITQIAIYTLYGMGVNLLVGYTGLASCCRRCSPWRLASCWAR